MKTAYLVTLEMEVAIDRDSMSSDDNMYEAFADANMQIRKSLEEDGLDSKFIKSWGIKHYKL